MSESRKKLLNETIRDSRGISKRIVTGQRESYYPLSGMATIEELERKKAEIGRQEERNKEMIKAKKKEQKRIIYEQVQLLRSLADNEGKDAAKYRDMAKYNPLPTMSKLLFSLALEEHEHEVRLVRLAEELTRTIL